MRVILPDKKQLRRMTVSELVRLYHRFAYHRRVNNWYASDTIRDELRRRGSPALEDVDN